ncbi:MAG: hypothetical protein KF830_03770 [Planctomycetes bacterium]|nr:hypothetical protein [Planctomycetota bacterium]
MPTSTAKLHAAFTLLVAGSLAAQAPTAPAPTASTAGPKLRPSPEGPLENLGLLYRSNTDPVLNELWFLGRYHGQYHWADGSNGDDEGYETRRFRIGGQARFVDRLTVHAQMVSGTDFEPFYNGFTELWVGWRFDDAAVLSVGQQKHRFTHDRNVSSRNLNVIERSQLTNMFGLDYTPAVTLSGRKGPWAYYGGVFSNATGTDMWDAFTELDSGWSALASVTYDFGRSLGTDTAFLNVSGVWSKANENATNLDYFDQGLATALILTDGSVSLITELTAGLGNPNGDAIGLNLQPGWFLTDELQLVARYQFAASDGDNGLLAQRRYERAAGMTSGDRYQAGYLGLNHYIAGHRVKVLTGIEYASLGGEDCWTFTVAFRLFWGPHAVGPFPLCDPLPGVW